MILVRMSKKKNDKFWKRAIKLMTIPETKGISIGYSTKQGNGNGIGKELSKKL